MDTNYGMKPFWFWNGDMQTEEMARQIAEMKDKGIGGFFIHPRIGLTIPYLSKQWALCECYHSIGWAMTLQDAKWIIDWLSVQGINLFVPHGYYYTANSLTKHDAPPSQFFQQPYWKHTGLLSDYVCSLSRSMTKMLKLSLVALKLTRFLSHCPLDPFNPMESLYRKKHR